MNKNRGVGCVPYSAEIKRQMRQSLKCGKIDRRRYPTIACLSCLTRQGPSLEANTMKTIIMLLVALISYVPTASAQQENPAFSQAELDQMLAPIALYPDALLSQILVAATYPLEVVEAARWSVDNPGLEGEQAANAAEHQPWDPSVKALVAFPGVLNRMNDDLNWTRALGDAFLFQEAQVMDSVQNLRQRAYEAGNLNSTENARVVRENQVIVIEPANPQVVYVPYYNPQIVYGSWWWPGYAPIYWGPPPGIHLNLGFNWGWGRGIFVSPGFFFSSFDWYRRQTVVVHRHHIYQHRPHFYSGRHVRYADFPRWQHNSNHRRGVAYRHDSLQRQFGTSRRFGADYANTRRNKFDRTDNINRSQSGRRNQGWSGYASTRNNDDRSTAKSTGRRDNRSDTDRMTTRDRWRTNSTNWPQSDQRNRGWSNNAATQSHDDRSTAQSSGRRDNRSDTDRMTTRDRWRTNSTNRPQSDQRNRDRSSYATTQSHDDRSTAQSSGRRDNRSDTDRMSTRDRWRQSSGISSSGLSNDLGSRNSSTNAQSASFGNTRRQSSTYNRGNAQRREISSQRTASDLSSNREAGSLPAQRRSSAPNRETNRNQDFHRQISSGATIQNRRASSYGPTSPAFSPERQQTRPSTNARVTRTENRLQTPSSSTTVSRDRGGSSTGVRYRPSNSNNSRGDSGGYSSGRSFNRRESSNSR
ncbi:DUF3300 domain-containing protein [Methylotuvimicrobium buryatense]|uniref:DUF3300 domain-containing protein n=2 Tax=Methylotuvimicrobium buryatense TaxID=95641 RepID=A0A4P9URT2_METBY|nr:DUF3300 domain-containing protein [Methylotuvimicrobium buryatense]